MHIDINCDLGEGLDNEKYLMPFVSSCNIACGGHAGDEFTMKAVAILAYQHKVKVGAHPSYPDRENFGRLSIDISSHELTATVQQQLQVFTSILNREAIPLHHIKPHGALYNDITKNTIIAKAFLQAIEKYKKIVCVYVPFGSIIEKEANKQGFKVKYEAFGDRSYNKDLLLVPRGRKNALLEDPKKVLQHIVTIAKKKRLRTVNNEWVRIIADTYCIHSDTPTALQILKYLSEKLPLYNLYL